MRNYLLAAVAAAALTSPAMARDKSTYVGVEGGVMLVEDTHLTYRNGAAIVGDALTIDHKTGFDVDLIAGYDFGLVRAEAEFGYKRAGVDFVQSDGAFIGSFGNPTVPYDANGKVSVLSGMANVLFDFGDQDGWSGFIGGGAGYARVKYNVAVPSRGYRLSDSDGSIAWQVLAGIRKSLSPNLDLGLKYRFFNVDKLRFNDGFIRPTGGELSGRYRSHSLLLSLTYNFYTPEAPPPPPEPERG